jgi:hypothetical protein
MKQKLVLRPGFEPGSRGREPPMLGRTTIGTIIVLHYNRLPELEYANPERERQPIPDTNKPFRFIKSKLHRPLNLQLNL